MSKNYTYYITFNKKPKYSEMSFHIGGESKEFIVAKVQGKKVHKLFTHLITTLSRHGGVVPIEVTDCRKVFAVREDLGPIIGAYMILLRRARDYNRWNRFLEALLDEKYPGFAIALINFLEMAIELSKIGHIHARKSGNIPYWILDLVSPSLKQFARNLEKKHISSKAYRP